jgi:hypothetical protein
VSVHVLSWVFRYSSTTLSDRLVLLVLADHAEGDGGNSYPSVQTISREARLSPRTVQYSLRSLEHEGAITRAGTSDNGTAIWQVSIPQVGGAESAPVADCAPAESVDCAQTVSSSGTEEEALTTPTTTGSGANQRVAEALAVFLDSGLPFDALKLEIGIGNAVGAFPHKDVVRAARDTLQWFLGPQAPSPADANANGVLMKILAEQSPLPQEVGNDTTAAAIATGQRHKDGCPFNECDGTRWVFDEEADAARQCRCHPAYEGAAA